MGASTAFVSCHNPVFPPSGRWQNGTSALLMACGKGHLHLARWLVEVKRANVFTDRDVVCARGCNLCTCACYWVSKAGVVGAPPLPPGTSDNGYVCPPHVTLMRAEWILGSASRGVLQPVGGRAVAH